MSLMSSSSTDEALPMRPRTPLRDLPNPSKTMVNRAIHPRARFKIILKKVAETVRVWGSARL